MGIRLLLDANAYYTITVNVFVLIKQRTKGAHVNVAKEKLHFFIKTKKNQFSKTAMVLYGSFLMLSIIMLGT